MLYDIILDRNLQRVRICGVRAGGGKEGGRGCDGFVGCGKLWEVEGEGGGRREGYGA